MLTPWHIAGLAAFVALCLFRPVRWRLACWLGRHDWGQWVVIDEQTERRLCRRWPPCEAKETQERVLSTQWKRERTIDAN